MKYLKELPLYKGLVNLGYIVVFSLVVVSQSSFANSKKHLVLQLKGSDIGEIRYIDTSGDGHKDTVANCFDVDVYNPANGKLIGTGTDCLQPTSSDGNEDITQRNIALTGTGFFHLKKGTLVVRGFTTVRPVLQTTSSKGVDFTHITGANGDAGVLYGTRKYRNSTGNVRLSGQVDMSELITDGRIYFDCIFIIEFD